MRPILSLSLLLERTAISYGLVPAFALAAFLEATFLPLIIDLVMFSFIMTGKTKIWKLVTAGAAASTLGTLLFWALGSYYGDTIIASTVAFAQIDPDVVTTLLQDFQNNWITATWIAMLTAIPDALVAILAGTQNISLINFGAVTAGALLTRFAILGGLVWVVSIALGKTGEGARTLISSLSLLVSLLLAGIGLVFMLI